MAENDDKKVAYEYFLKKAKDGTQKARIEDALNLSLREFTKVGNKELGLNCPRDWKPCDDGSCVPPGVDCP